MQTKINNKTGLKVPYVKQVNNYCCGPASLEMVYDFYGLEDIPQLEIFEKHKIPNPESQGGYMLYTRHLVEDAKMRGFSGSYFKQMDLDDKNASMIKIHNFIESGIPVIVNQHFNMASRDIGHFRVIYKIYKDFIYFHDPIDENISKWRTEKFWQHWQVGGNVIGGVYLIIKK